MARDDDCKTIGIVVFVATWVVAFICIFSAGIVEYTMGTDARYLCEGIYPWGPCTNSWSLGGSASNCAYILVDNYNCSLVDRPLTPASLYAQWPKGTYCLSTIPTVPALPCVNATDEAFQKQTLGAQLMWIPVVVTVGALLLGFGSWFLFCVVWKIC